MKLQRSETAEIVFLEPLTGFLAEKLASGAPIEVLHLVSSYLAEPLESAMKFTGFRQLAILTC